MPGNYETLGSGGHQEFARKMFEKLKPLLTRLQTQIDGKQAAIICGTMTLTTSWTETATGSGIYTQTVVISGVTANSKIDLQPDAIVINQMYDDGCKAIYAVNNNGTITAYAVGAALTAAVTVGSYHLL